MKTQSDSPDGPDLMIAVGGPGGETGDEMGMGMGSQEQCVPLDALAMPDEGEELAAPEEGDEVNYQVMGKVTRIQNGMAYVKPSAINGVDLDKPAEAEAEGAEPASPEQKDAADYSALEDQAQNTQL